MLKFEYLIVYSYINEKKEWVVNYLGNELYMDLLPALFCELGSNGWEMISSSTHIQGEVVNRALIPLRADTDVGISNTSTEVFYFKRILENDSQNSNSFNKQIEYIRSLTEEHTDRLNRETENSLSTQVYIDSVEDFILSKGFEKGKTISDCDYSFYKNEITEQINKGLFGSESKKELTVEKRIDLIVLEDSIVYKYFEKVGNNNWTKYEDKNILLDEESIKSFIENFN